MNGITHIRGSSLSLPTGETMPGAAAPGSLLPPSEAPSQGQLQGMMTSLELVMCQLRDAQISQSKTRVDVTKKERELVEQKQAEQLARAREAAQKGCPSDWLSRHIAI